MSDILLPGDAGFADVLSGRGFSSKSGYGVVGTMPNNGAVNINPGPSQQAVAQGYHSGSGVVQGVSVPAGNVLTGTTIAGTAGTMPNQGALLITPGPNAQGIPAGYHNGSGSVPGVNVPAGNVLTGTTIAGTTGSMPNNGAPTWTPTTADQAVSPGYFSGGIVKGSASLVAGNIATGANIFNVDGTVDKGVYLSLPSSQFHNSVTPTAMKRVTMNMKVNSLGLVCDLWNPNNNGYIYGQFYKNGIAIGSQFSTNTNAAIKMGTVTPCVPGDVIEVYTWASGTNVSMAAMCGNWVIDNAHVAEGTGGTKNLGA